MSNNTNTETSENETGMEKKVETYEVTFPVVCPGHSRPVVDVRYSPVTEDGTFLISACHDKLPMVRWADNGDWIGTLEGHKGAVWSACLNHDATRAATGSADFSAKLWNSISGKEIHTFDHKHIVKSVEFSKDGTQLLTGGLDKTLRIFDLGNPDQTPISLDAKDKIRRSSWLNSENQIVICACEDGFIRKWDIRSQEIISELKAFEKSGVKDLEISAHFQKLICCGGNVVKIYNSDTFELCNEIEVKNDIEAASLHPSGKRFIAGGADLWVHEYDLVDNGNEIACHKGHHGPIFCMRYDPEGKTYASGSEDGTIRLWSATP
uniref:Serine-threonine kinase receptor-associated protein n=1 Tax=Aplanochytrium stocchinoi TaxID=215587 RepID=A0A7S3LHF8_9STRA|mmetsp:Transcript_35106/g.43314  ORF Transcript_35106/g.43314 Transcript_35106/m.43314 type:complete len:322 (-) Transcript_35106:47-1012(-)